MEIIEAKLAYSFIELGEVPILNSPKEAADYIRRATREHYQQEGVWVIPLDRKNRVLCRSLVTLGTVSSTLVSPREILRICILAGASAAIVAHNHPSGDPAPSSADIRVTRMLRESFQIMDIIIDDHIIVGEADRDPTGLGYYSFRDAGLLG